MSFKKYWKKLVRRHPVLADDNRMMSCSVGTLRRCLEVAYKTGEHHAAEKLAKSKKSASDKTPRNPLNSLLDYLNHHG